MPRPAAVPVDDIFDVLKNQVIYEPDGNLKPRKDEIWRKASRRLDRKITPSTLRFYVSKNWKNLRQRLKLFYNQKAKYGYEANSAKLVDRCLQMKFDMSVPKDKWELIKPVLDEQGKKRMAKGWNRYLGEVILERTELPCVFTNMRGSVYKTNNDFKFAGTCGECGNPIEGKYFFIYGMHCFEIVTRNTKSIEHKIKLSAIPIQKDPKPQETKRTEMKKETPQPSQNTKSSSSNNPYLRAPYNPPRTRSRSLATSTQSVKQMEEMRDTKEIQNESESKNQQIMEQTDEITANPKIQIDNQCEDQQLMEQTDEITATPEIQNDSQSGDQQMMEQPDEITATPKIPNDNQCEDQQLMEQTDEILATPEIHNDNQSEDQQMMEQTDEITVTHEIQSIQSNGLDQIQEAQITIEFQEEPPCQNLNETEQVHVIHVAHETEPVVQLEEQNRIDQTDDAEILDEPMNEIQYQVPQQSQHVQETPNTPVIQILIPVQATNISTLG